VDIVSHYFWKHRFPVEWTQMYPDAPIPREELKAYENVVDEFHEFFDEQLGAMLEYADEDTAVIVLSDHGFVTGRREHARFGASKTVSGVHSRAAPPGIIVMAGAGVREKISLVGATVYDVAPTVLELMGYEIPPEMRGRVLDEALAEAPR
jgi:predicted AlkP superfamily phosphohydrolase/phosphomutase